MTSRVTSDLKFELTGLNDLCYHSFLASKCFLEMIRRKEEGLRLPSIDSLGAMALARKKTSGYRPLRTSTFYHDLNTNVEVSKLTTLVPKK